MIAVRYVVCACLGRVRFVSAAMTAEEAADLSAQLPGSFLVKADIGLELKRLATGSAQNSSRHTHPRG